MRPPTVRVRRPDLDGRAFVALLAIVAIAGVLRTVGIRFGTPYVYHPDEWAVAETAMTMVRTGDWNPHLFLYSSFLIDLEAILVAVRHAMEGVTLVTDQAWLHEGEVLPEQFGYVLTGRLMVMGMGVATVAVVFEAARRIAGPGAGLAAAAILAVTPLHALHSHYLTTDVPVALLCALTLLATLHAVVARRDRWWLLAGILAGLSGSTKWNGLMVVGVPVLAWMVTSLDVRHITAGLRGHALWLIGGGAVIGLIVATPAIVLDAAAVAETLRLQAALYSVARPDTTDNTFVFHARALVEGVGVALIPCLAGLVIIALRARGTPVQRAAIAVPAFVVAYVVLASLPPRFYERNLMPILPYLAVAGGVAASAAVAWLHAATRRRAGPADAALATRSPVLPTLAVSGVLIALLIPAIMSSVAAAQALRQPDTRTAALEWMIVNVPRGTRIARELGTPQTSPDRFNYRGSYFLWQHDLAFYRAQGVRYMVASSAIYSRFLGIPSTPRQDAFYRELFALPEVYRLDASPDRPGPTIRIFRLDPQ